MVSLIRPVVDFARADAYALPVAMEEGPSSAQSPPGLLVRGDPPPVEIRRGDGRSPFLLLGDHAGNASPAALGDLGLEAGERRRHIAWDIGVRALGEKLADDLDAPFLHQPYSRLVIDCNRAPGSPQSIVAASDGTPVPGNAGLDPGAAEARIAAVHRPYHAAIAAEIAQRRSAGMETILVSLHSFTPVMGGIERPWDAGILHDRGEAGFSLRLLERLRAVAGLCVGDNEPYRMDEIDFTIPFHAWPAGLAYAEVEVRQDQLSTPEGVSRWAAILAEALAAAA
jgi:predicted N-formylglutamate amidohydrolase